MGCISFSRGSSRPRIKPGSSALQAVSLLRRQGSRQDTKCPSAPSHPSHIVLNFPLFEVSHEKFPFPLPYTQTAHLGPLCLSKMSPFSDWSYASLVRTAWDDTDIHSEGGTVWDVPPSSLNPGALKNSPSSSPPAPQHCLQLNFFCSTSPASSTRASRGHCLP